MLESDKSFCFRVIRPVQGWSETGSHHTGDLYRRESREVKQPLGRFPFLTRYII